MLKIEREKPADAGPPAAKTPAPSRRVLASPPQFVIKPTNNHGTCFLKLTNINRMNNISFPVLVLHLFSFQYMF